MAKKNSTYWEKRIAKNIWTSYNNLEERNRELLNLYETSCKNIREELYELAEKYSKDGVLSRTDMYRQNRLKALEQEYVKIVEELGGQIEKTATNNMQQSFKEIYNVTMESLNVTEFAMPSKKTMNAILKEPWQGSNFSKRLWGGNNVPGQMQKLVNALDGVLVYGLQTGKTVTQMAIELNNVMHKGFNAAHTLVRTEAMHYMNTAALQGYQDAGIQYVQIWTAPDERRCDECGKYHGKIYPIDKCPVLPFHPNCRCTVLPVADEKEIAEYIARNEQNSTFTSHGKSGKVGEEKYLKKFKKDRAPVSIEDALRGTNPNYDPNDFRYSENCQRCVATYEMIRRGYHVTAKPILFKPDAIMDDYTLPWRSATKIGCPKGSGMDLIEQRMLVYGDGARVAVRVHWDGENYGHVFIAEQVEGKTMYIDPQTNEVDVSYYFNYAKNGATTFARIDNLDVTAYIKDCCEEVKE